MAGSGLPVATWFCAVALILGSEGHITPRRLSEKLGVSYKTALRLKKRIGEALTTGSADAALLQRLGREIAAHGEPTGHSLSAPPEKAAKARDKIRAAACRAFAENGLAGTRIADIAREAHVSSAIVHYYFKSKDEVLLGAIEWANEQASRRLQEAFSGCDDHVERLRRLLDEAVPDVETAQQEYLLWLEVWPRTRRHPEALASCMAISELWLQFVTRVVAEGVEAGVFTLRAPLEEIVLRIVSLADGYCYRSVVGYEMMHVRRARQLLANFAAEQLDVPAEALAPR